MSRSLLADTDIRRVTDVNDQAMDGFVATYVDVFAEPPYLETYEPLWVVEHVWRPHMPHCVMVAEYSGRVVGLACCHAADADTEPAIKAFLLSREYLPFDPSRTVFMSELAVRHELRRIGLATSLVYGRLRWAREAGFTHYAMRTAEMGSNSEGLYRRIGARRAPFIQDVSDGGVTSASTQRIYLWGEIAVALAGDECGEH